MSEFVTEKGSLDQIEGNWIQRLQFFELFEFSFKCKVVVSEVASPPAETAEMKSIVIIKNEHAKETERYVFLELKKLDLRFWVFYAAFVEFYIFTICKLTPVAYLLGRKH